MPIRQFISACIWDRMDIRGRKRERKTVVQTSMEQFAVRKNEQSTGLRYEIDTTFKHLRGIEAFLL